MIANMAKQADMASVGGVMPMVATGIVKPEKVVQRQGPGDSYAAIVTKEAGDIAGIIGRDATGNWLYVLTSEGYGWLPTTSLHFTGDVSLAPVLPNYPRQTQQTARPVITSTKLANTSQVTATHGNTNSVSVPPPALTDLKPTAKAIPQNNILNLRQGPGGAYNLLATLKGEKSLAVLAQNKTKDWLLVQTADGKLGWVSLSLVNVDGSLADVPTVISAGPQTPIPDGQIAPISGLVNPSGQSISPQNSAVVSNPIVTEAAITEGHSPVIAASSSSSAAMQISDLRQVATARLALKEVEMRSGAGNNFGLIDTLKADDEDFYILGLDESKSWALVKRTFYVEPKVGWVLLNQLKFSDSVANAPQVVTAWVESNGVDLRPGPGIEYGVTSKLGQNTLLTVHGFNPNKNWVLVKPVLGGGVGWISRQFLKNNGSLANVPEVAGPPALAEASPFALKTVAPQGMVVFQLSSGGDIMLINADGSGLHRLTNGIDPVLSSDKKQVAFTRWQGESGSVWLINVDGTGERQIIGNIKQAKGAEWSSDGSQIIINFQDGGRLENKQDCFNLTKGSPDRPPRNARDFKVKMEGYIPFFCWTIPPDAHWHLKMINVADGSFKDINGGEYAFRPTWDPGQSWRVVADSGSGLQEVNVNENSNRRITTVTGDGSPVFSADGRYLAVVVGDISGSPGHDIYRLNGDGNGRLRLTKTPLWVTSGPDKGKLWNNVAPAWSPDGALVAFLTDRNGRWEIWVMNNDGSEQRPMFFNEVSNQLPIQYNFVDERVLSWR